jgi:hypothetical protein
MDPKRSTSLLKRQQDAIAPLSLAGRSGPEFSKWQRDTEVAIGRIFGEQSRHLKDFQAISYSLSVYFSGMPDHLIVDAFRGGLAKAAAILQSLIDEILEYEIDEDEPTLAPDHLNLLERICLRFHAAARQLQDRHSDRPTLTIDDEYDVQDLLHALLRIHFDDIRAEEWTPSYAGSASRVDFLLKAEGIVVEVKKTRPSMKSAELGAQLLVDIARYAKHPDCRTLVCFIYDPEGRIGNPVGIERDLEGQGGALKVRVIIAPRS